MQRGGAGDLNARVRENLVANVVRYGVPVRNDTGESLIEMCIEQEEGFLKKMLVASTSTIIKYHFV